VISGRDFIFLSSIEWEPLWQAHQEIASRLARAGNRVLYVENTGVRHPGLRDTARLMARLRAWTRGLRSHGLRQVAPRLWVSSPLVLPPFGSPLSRQLNARFLAPLLARGARRLGMRDPIVWTYLPTDTAAALIDCLRSPRGLTVYSCLADFAELTPDREALERWEARILNASDLVFALPGLVEHCRRHAQVVHPYRSAVSLEAFREPYVAVAADPLRRLVAMPRPRVGYVGGLHRHVDLDLLGAIARARPEWSWACVGPRQAPVAELEDLPNVHLLGPVRHRELAPLIDGFDVCIVPYRDSEFMRTVLPTKIMEYLAMGKPVVSTPLPAARELEDRDGVVMTAPPDPRGFVAALEQALTLPPDGRHRRAVAAERGWDRELERIGDLLVSRLP
jgi:glycosyltransferase involved in cell wall biosynthesis